MKFDNLVFSIQQVHTHFQQQAVKAVNVTLTLRNWLVGYYIVEFEQNGEDRARYGAELIEKLAQQIDIKGLGTTNLKTTRIFYQAYSFLQPYVQSLLPQLQGENIGQLPTDESFTTPFTIGQSAGAFAAELEPHIPTFVCDTLEKAVQQAWAYAHQEALNPAYILLSPACASFDQFESFEHRGDVFATIVRDT
ncbi:MAG: DUF1016 N-terminal domain-containing protein, partial [Bacteroidia bacterium]